MGMIFGLNERKFLTCNNCDLMQYSYMPTNSPENLHQTLIDAIKQGGITQNQLAKMTGVDRGRISRFVTGDRDVTFDAACRLLAALDFCVVRSRGAIKDTEYVPDAGHMVTPETHGAMIQKYGMAVRTYLSCLIPDQLDAEKTFNTMIACLEQGHIESWNGRSHFREYLKRIATTFASVHRQISNPNQEKIALPDIQSLDQIWRDQWRSCIEVIARMALKGHKNNHQFHAWRFREDNPTATYKQLAEEMSKVGDKQWSAKQVETLLTAANQSLAQTTLDEVVATVYPTNRQTVRAELEYLGLLHLTQAQLPDAFASGSPDHTESASHKKSH